jgi:hypothetical protein
VTPAGAPTQRAGRRPSSTGSDAPGRPALSDRLPRAWLFPLLAFAVVSTVYVIMIVATAVGVALMLAARLPVPVSLYGVLMVLTFAISTATPRPRAVWVAFPLFIGAAAKLPRVIYWPVLVLSAAGLVFLVGWWPNHYAGPAP